MNDNEKDNYVFAAISIFIIWLVILFSVLCSGCTGTRFYIDDQDGRSAIRTISKLEEQIAQLDSRIESIAAGSEDIETDLSRFAESFRIYVDTVRAMRSELDEYRKQTSRNENETD